MQRKQGRQREGSPFTGLGPVFVKELSDHLSSTRMMVLTLFVIVFGALPVGFTLQEIRTVTASDQFLFLRIFTVEPERMPLSFVVALNFMIPLMAIGLGFDSVNSEFNRRTLSRVLSQPLYRDALRATAAGRAGPAPRAALMTAGFCHEDPRVVAERGTELVGWYIEQQRERARLVWRDYDPTTVPPDYQGYYARDQRLAGGPYPGEPTPEEVREEGTKFCVGTPAECIRSLGIEEAILLCAVGPARHQEVLHTLRLFGEEVIPHFQAKAPPATPARASA